MPSKSVSPVLGYNNNIRYRGHVFHIQTEDSGIKYGHIITHLFMDGGRILKSVKTSYAHVRESADIAEMVRNMMKDQHKAMAISLRQGAFDSLLEAASMRPSAAPGARVSAMPPSVEPPSPLADTLPSVVGGRHGHGRVPGPPLSPGLGDRAHLASGSHAAVPGTDTLKSHGTPPRMPVAAPDAAGPARGSRAGSKPRVPAGAPAFAGDDRRPLPRPASSFGQARPQQGQSIFGGELVRDKSLDDVILGYVKAEAEAPKGRKR